MDSQVGLIERESELAALSIYPNPSTEFINVNLGERASGKGKLEITDISGRIVLKTEVLPGYAIYQLQISDLPQGLYMISWIEDGELKARNKLIRTR